MIKVGVIIPDRGDRPEFLRNCLRVMHNQTLHPYTIVLVSPETLPVSNECDITPRYRKGYNYISSLTHPVDVIALIENDDFYSYDYLETMVKAWDAHGRPDLFGTNYTIYYHLKVKAYFTMQHEQRASAMNTLIKPGLEFSWCPDNEPYLDEHLWGTIQNRIVFHPEKVISIGMKHGVGKCGGRSHVDRLGRYTEPDNGFLEKTVDAESFQFYSTIKL